MPAGSVTDSFTRQVLVNFGNRYAVFGHELALPQPADFSPDRDSELLPQVDDESEVAHERILQTLRVSGMERATAPPDSQGDIAFTNELGRRVIVELKVRENDPKRRDVEQAVKMLQRQKGNEQTELQVWFFNIERLALKILSMKNGVPGVDDFTPIDVWAKTESGIFSRAQVVAEVDSWVARINALYMTIQDWLDEQPELRFDRTRTVTMSEELMREFAVTDRDLPILDVTRGEQVIASFVPRGLWLIGAWGRVDVITSNSTYAIVGIRENPADDVTFQWQLASSEGRRKLKPLIREALLSILTTK